MTVVLAGRFRRNHAHKTLQANQSSADLLDINASSGLQSSRFRRREGMGRRHSENRDE